MGLIATFSLLAPALAGSVDAHWADIESQIQYAYYAEDLRALENLATTLSARAASDAHAAYFTALADYHLAELIAERDRSRAAAAADRCASTIGAALGAGEDAEPIALAAACSSLSHSLQSFKLPLVARRAEADLTLAAKLAPRSPRVALLDGEATYTRSAAPEERDRARRRFEDAARLFEIERQGIAGVPGWGAAEAYADLGRACLDRGDATAARAALERSLLLAPDFVLARHLMARILGQ